ncbi:MAG: glutaredoxin domain-containing protein, partial [Eubacterium sp.]
FCPFCNHAKKLLTTKGLKYTEVSIDGNYEMKQALKEKTGQSTVPFIFIEDTFVGGYNELAELDNKGDLDKMLI